MPLPLLAVAAGRLAVVGLLELEYFSWLASDTELSKGSFVTPGATYGGRLLGGAGVVVVVVVVVVVEVLCRNGATYGALVVVNVGAM